MKNMFLNFKIIGGFLIFMLIAAGCGRKTLSPEILADKITPSDKYTFSMSVPEGWKKGDPRPEDPNEVFFAYTGSFKIPALTVKRVNAADVSSATSAGGSLCKAMSRYWEADGCEVIYSKGITLNDGSSAFESQVKWKHPFANVYTAEITVTKNGVAYGVSAHGLKKISGDLLKYLYNFRIVNK